MENLWGIPIKNVKTIKLMECSHFLFFSFKFCHLSTSFSSTKLPKLCLRIASRVAKAVHLAILRSKPHRKLPSWMSSHCHIQLLYLYMTYDLCNLIIYLNHLLGFILREMLFETKRYNCFMTFHSLRIPTCWVVPSLKAPGHRWPPAKQVMQSLFGFWLSCLLCVCTNCPHPIQDSGAEHLEGVQGHYCQEGVFESTIFFLNRLVAGSSQNSPKTHTHKHFVWKPKAGFENRS